MNTYLEWCNENAGRKYPLDEGASCIDIYGHMAPTDILVDAMLFVPEVYSNVFCTILRATPAVLSVAFASPNNPLFVASIARNTYVPYTAVPLTPLCSGVSGWVVFGDHVACTEEIYAFRSISQSGMALRTVRNVQASPVVKLLRLGDSTQSAVDGLVQLLGGNGLKVYPDPTNASQIIVELDPNMAEALLGPCDHYADAGMCRVPPIRSINGVAPDANGILTLSFEG